MLYAHIKQNIISHTRGDTCNQTFNLHFHTLPCLQHHGGGGEKDNNNNKKLKNKYIPYFSIDTAQPKLF
jgi:hypothetical protein